MLGTGVASFGHMNHVHIQNTSSWDEYTATVKSGRLPLSRGLVTTAEERLVREVILQMKLGQLAVGYFRQKFDVDILQRFAPAFEKLHQEGMLKVADQAVELTEKGLLQVDQLLPEFYNETFRNSRYT